MVNEIDIIQNRILLTENEQAFIEQKKKEQQLKNSLMELAQKTDYNRFFQIGILDVYKGKLNHEKPKPRYFAKFDDRD